MPDAGDACVVGWEAIGARLRNVLAARGARKTVLVVECYFGVAETQVRDALIAQLKPKEIIAARDALKSASEIDRLCQPFLGGSDPVFGYLSNLALPQFFDAGKVALLAQRAASVGSGLVLVVGAGAGLVTEGDVLVYADLARWEIQQRFRRKELGNFGCPNASDWPGAKYKRAFFNDWRVADRWIQALLPRFDILLRHPRHSPAQTG